MKRFADLKELMGGLVQNPPAPPAGDEESNELRLLRERVAEQEREIQSIIDLGEQAAEPDGDEQE